jgi:hypothetical protein
MTRARDVADTQENNGGGVPPFVAGKNAIINGDFGIWQRGTSSLTGATSTTTGFTSDRWQLYRGSFATNITASRVATSDTTNLANIRYAARVQRTAGDTSTQFVRFLQTLETGTSVPFAGKTITFSVYVRVGANFSATSNAFGLNVNYGTGTDQNFISGFTGDTSLGTIKTASTTWQRISATVSIPATATQLAVYAGYSPTGTAGAADYFEITGVQLEAGNVATPFTTATGTVQGELAACQRYYYRSTPGITNGLFATGSALTTTDARYAWKLPVTMRIIPTAVDYAAAAKFRVTDGVNAPAEL